MLGTRCNVSQPVNSLDTNRVCEPVLSISGEGWEETAVPALTRAVSGAGETDLLLYRHSIYPLTLSLLPSTLSGNVPTSLPFLQDIITGKELPSGKYNCTTRSHHLLASALEKQPVSQTFAFK